MNTPTSWRRTVLAPESTLHDAIQCLNDIGLRIVLVCDATGVLLGTVSDGDIRRGLLRGLMMASAVLEVTRRSPLVVPEGMSREMVLQLMAANKVQQIPVVDARGVPVGLHVWDELTTPAARPNLMVIMAGGSGTRLRPHTEFCPKPMLPVAGRPMLEHIIERANRNGFKHFLLAVHYLAHIVKDHFGSGEKFGVEVDYLNERNPLGTAGALSLLPRVPDLPFVVTNGDVLTDIRYDELLDFHVRHGAAATMAVRMHEWQHPFGVVQMDGVDIVGFEEKPVARTHINAGIYALSPVAIDVLDKDEHCDMPAVFERLRAQGKRIVAYPMHEPWLDVGRPDDLLNAAKSVASSLRQAR